MTELPEAELRITPSLCGSEREGQRGEKLPSMQNLHRVHMDLGNQAAKKQHKINAHLNCDSVV